MNNFHQRTEESKSYSKLYKKARWINERAWFLRNNPLCVFCKHDGIATGADVVDHITPHKGNLDLFWDQKNWQPLCNHHHNSTKQAMERNTRPATGLDGWPLED